MTISYLEKDTAVHAALEELQVAENFFNLCEPHQLDLANARLTAARIAVDTAVNDIKLNIPK